MTSTLSLLLAIGLARVPADAPALPVPHHVSRAAAISIAQLAVGGHPVLVTGHDGNYVVTLSQPGREAVVEVASSGRIVARIVFKPTGATADRAAR